VKIIKKISKGLLILIIFLISLVLASYFLIKSTSFQNWAAQKAVAYLEKELKTKVGLKSIEFKLINTLVLKGLYIEDLHHDTLGYFGKLEVRFNYKLLFDNKLQLARIKSAVLQDTKVFLTIHSNEKDFNYQFLVDYFSPPSTTPSTGPYNPFKLLIRELEFKNVTFRYRDKDVPAVKGRRFDESYMEFREINGRITPFLLYGDSLNMDIHNFSFREKSGFEVKEFTANTIISSSGMDFRELSIKTPYSKIGDHLKFSYWGYGQLSDFVDSVKWDAHLSKSVVSMKDIAYFSDELIRYAFPISISGIAKGTLSNLNAKKMDITIGKLNRFRGDMVLKDMTNLDKLNYNLNVTELFANPSSIQDLIQSKFPEELLRIGSIRYTGLLSGGLKDINTRGIIETTLGNISTDLRLDFPSERVIKYKGEIETFGFNLGKLMNTSTLGNISISTTVDGSGFNINDLDTKLDGTVRLFDIDGNTFSNIDLDGFFKKKQFKGKLDIDDPNVQLNLVGSLDLNNNIMIGDFKGVIGIVNLEKLGYGDINIKQISFMDIKFEGKEIDDMKMDASLSNVILSKKDSTYELGNIYLNADGPYNSRVLTLKSDIGNININGNYKISYLKSISNNLLYNLFPDYYSNLKGKIEPVDVQFDIDIPDSRLITALFLPEVEFKELTVRGIYNSTNQNLDIIARTEHINFDKYTLKNLELNCTKYPGQRLSLSSKVGGFLISDSLITDKLSLAADLGGNDINFKLNAADSTHDLSFKTGGNIVFYRNKIDFNLMNSTIFIKNKPWEINNINHFSYINSSLNIDSFKISNGIQSMSIDGIAGVKNLEDINVKFDQFNMAELNPVLQKWNIGLEGIINGNFTLNGTNNRPIIESGISINNFAVNGDTIGDLVLNSRADGSPYKMNVNGKIKNGLINDLLVEGNIDLTPGNDKIDLSLILKEASIKPFEIFTVGLFSKIEGTTNATLRIKGPIENPDIKGNVEVYNASLFMDYLGLPLKVDKMAIEIDESAIDLGTFDLLDKYGSIAHAGGKIYHKKFSNFRYDIFIKDLKNFNCLDLDEAHADMFYGVAFVDGNMTVKGPQNAIRLSIKAKTRPHTQLSLPLSNSSENSGPDFIEIVDLRSAPTNSKTKSLSGIFMDFDFDITEDAEIRMIFDAKFDDMIRATGEGNIKMQLNTFGDFYMDGTYEIAKGSYNFTALNNLINKNLKVRPGGKISWNGNPLEARVDLVAVTTVKVDPTVILPASSSTASAASNVAVDCEIYLKDNLFNPQIKLGINLSQENQASLFANSDLTNAINQIKADQDETDKQFINLMVFYSFAPLNNTEASGGTMNVVDAGKKSIGDFMTNQLNNWLNQIDPNWELGVDFTTSSNADANSQIIVSLRRKLYNDRIEIGGTYGQSGNTSYDINVSYKIRKDGRMSVRAFNRRANDPISINVTPINSSGLGLYYRKEIDYIFPKFGKWFYEWRHR